MVYIKSETNGNGFFSQPNCSSHRHKFSAVFVWTIVLNLFISMYVMNWKVQMMKNWQIWCSVMYEGVHAIHPGSRIEDLLLWRKI